MVNALPSGVAVSPRAAANLKRSLVLAMPIGALALLVLALLGHPLAGVFVVLGLAFGVLNTWLMQRSVVRYGERRSFFSQAGTRARARVVPAVPGIDDDRVKSVARVLNICRAAAEKQSRSEDKNAIGWRMSSGADVADNVRAREAAEISE